MTVINDNRGFKLKPGEDSIIAGILAIGYALFVFALGFKPPAIILSLQAMLHFDHLSSVMLLIGLIYFFLGLGVYFESRSSAWILFGLHFIVFISALGYPTYLFSTHQITKYIALTFYGVEIQTPIFITVLFLGLLVFGFGIYAASNIDEPYPQVVATQVKEVSTVTELAQEPVVEVVKEQLDSKPSTEPCFLEVEGDIPPAFNGQYQRNLQQQVIDYSEDMQAPPPPPVPFNEDDQIITATAKLIPQFIDVIGVQQFPTQFRDLDPYNDYYDNLNCPDNDYMYFQIKAPKDLLIVFNFKFILRGRRHYCNSPSLIRFLRRVDSVYYQEERMERLDYDGDLKIGYEYQLPMGKLLIIYEWYLFIPYLTVAVCDQVLPDSPSNPYNRAQLSAKMAYIMGALVFAFSIFYASVVTSASGTSTLPIIVWVTAGVGLVYIFCGFGIQAMNRLAAGVASIMQILLLAAAVNFVVSVFLQDFTGNMISDFLAGDVFHLILVLILIIGIIGYLGLFILNAYVAIKEYETY